MASLIEEFLYKFSADTTGYNAGAKAVTDGNKKATESMKQTDVAAKKLVGGLKDLARNALGAAAAFLSLAGIKAVTTAAAERTIALAADARALRMNADDLDVWQRANEAAGGSASEMTATFKMLSERTREPIKALENIADRFKGISDLRADRLGAALGIDKGTVQLLRNGKEGLVEFIRTQQSLGQVTEQQIAAAREWRLQTKLTGFVMDDIGRLFMAKLIPGASDWLKTMRGALMWMRDNKEFTLAFFGGIATVLTARLLPALIRVGIAALPWILLAAAVAAVGAAIGLVVDDLMAFEDGGKSLVGEIAQQWPVIGDIVRAIIDVFYIFRDVAGAVFGYVRDMIFEPAKALENLQSRMGAIMDAVGERFPLLATLLKGLGGGIASYFKAVATGLGFVFDIISKIGSAIAWVAGKLGITEAAGKVLAEVPNMVGTGGERYKSPGTVGGAPQEQAPGARAAATVEAGKGVVAAAESSPLAATTSSAISTTNNNRNVNKSTQVTTGPITVNTQATDGKDVAAALGKSLGAQVKGAIDEFDDGVAI